MREIAPEAYLDALLIVSEAPSASLPVSVPELHLYAYLACVLGLFRGNAVSNWGYSFAITSEGFPFSVAVDEARELLIGSSLVDLDDNSRMTGNDRSCEELAIVLQIKDWGARRDWLRAATDCSLALPVGAIRHAVARSPGVSSAFLLGQRAHLLEPEDTTLLYDEYRIVSSVLGADVQDLLSPAVMWLSARLIRTEKAIG